MGRKNKVKKKVCLPFNKGEAVYLICVVSLKEGGNHNSAEVISLVRKPKQSMEEYKYS